MSAVVRSFRDLEVWKLGREIVLDVYDATVEFPKREMFGLVNQMRGAAVSIPSNIAEGYNRQHRAEYRQFLCIALGSCGELDTQVELSADIGFLTTGTRIALLSKLDHEGKMLRRLIARLR